MDKEQSNIGLKRKFKPRERLFDSDDDEPIGTLLKLKGRRNSNKNKVVSDGMNKVKGAEKMTAKDEELGMHDTLAIFRKKLRGPKKDYGSMAGEGNFLSDIIMEPLCESLTESAADIELVPNSIARLEGKGVSSTEGECSWDAAFVKSLKAKAKKISKVESNIKLVETKSELHDGFDHQRSENDSLKSVEECILESGGELLEYSMSPFNLKACSSKFTEFRNGEVNSDSHGRHQVSADDTSSSRNIIDRCDVNFVAMKDNTPRPLQEPHVDAKCEKEDRVDHLDAQLNLTALSTNKKICPSVREDPKFRDESNLLNKKSEETFLSSHRTLPDENLELLTSYSELEKIGGHVKPDRRLDCELHPVLLEKVQLQPLTSAFNRQKKEHSSAGHDSSVRIFGECSGEKDLASISSQEEGDKVSNCRLSLENHKYEVASRMNHENVCQRIVDESERALESSHEPRECAFPPSDDYPSGDEETEMTTYAVTMLDEGSSPEDKESPDGPEMKESSLSVRQRAARNAKKRKLGDMAYEGDADWEVFVQGQEFFVSYQAEKTREKFISSSMALDAQKGKAAAVSAGLKARAVGPIEKIKFKEVLKRKGGLQEYLECRNHILSVWNKDVSSILRLLDLGVSDARLEGESPRSSLIRDIFIFLDQYGFVNFGVPSEKEKVHNYIKHDSKLLTEKPEDNFCLAIADSVHRVSSSHWNEKSSDTSTRMKNDDVLSDGKEAVMFSTKVRLDNVQVSESSAAPVIHEGHAPDYSPVVNSLEPLTPKTEADLDYLGSNPSHKDENAPGEVSAVPSKIPEICSAVLSSAMDCTNSQIKNGSQSRKSIIVVGAGPAGLTAARHLQRQGFSVTVLEARSRIGGRVFTDHSSLSVPVDLGASIITGTEADVDTERRPDPSSLICGQLGLELTVLNSDCPLYDSVTAQKVHADLDEALEAEYNSLLDEMQLLVAEKGEYALNMSLEEGLEYALKRRRLSSSESDDMGVVPVKYPRNSLSTESFSNGQDATTESLSPLERRVMDWHFAHLEYGCAASLKEVSLPNWNQDDVYGGFGGAHCMVKGGYSAVVDSLGEGICIKLDHVVSDIAYFPKDCAKNDDICEKVKVTTSNGEEFSGDAVLVTVPLGCLKAESIKFSPPLPQWKYSSIKRLGFGILNKVVLEFQEVFWDDTVDYFGATAEYTDQRGRCFMFWNVKKTVGAPVLIALVVGKAAIDGQEISSSDHVSHALLVLRKLFGEERVSDPVASVVTDWGRDPYSYGAYSYVAVGSSGEDYDILGRPVENCIFFAGEATCKEHPDTVGGAMMSGLREAVRIIDILNSGVDYTAEVEAMEAARRHSDIEKSEVKDLIRKLEAVEFSSFLYKNSLDRLKISKWGSMLKDMFFNAKTTSGRLHLAKELLNLPVGFLKSFASTREGLSILNSWILDSMGKDGTQLLRHCVRLLVLVSNDLLAVRVSGIGKTVKEKVCVHTSRDIRAIASQLVNVWVELFRKEKAAKRGLKSLRQSSGFGSKSSSSLVSGRPPIRTHHAALQSKETLKASASAGHRLPSGTSAKKLMARPIKMEARIDSKADVQLSHSHGSTGCENVTEEEASEIPMSAEEKAAIDAAEAARSAAIAAAKAYASYGVMNNAPPQLPKILSFQKFATRDQFAHMDESDCRKKWSGAAIGTQDCLSEIDSRNCRVRDWSVDFSAAGVNLDNSKFSADNHSQRSHSNEIASPVNFREHSGESVAVDNNILAKAWVDSAGSTGLKDYNAIERWQCQAAAAASSGFSHDPVHINDEDDSNMSSKLHTWKHDAPPNDSSASQVTINKESRGNQLRGTERIKQSVVDYVASLLMPLYKARKIDKEGYKSIMKKTATKVMEQATDAEKAMAVTEFLDFKRKTKIRAFVDTLIERHMAIKSDGPKN